MLKDPGRFHNAMVRYWHRDWEAYKTNKQLTAAGEDGHLEIPRTHLRPGSSPRLWINVRSILSAN